MPVIFTLAEKKKKKKGHVLSRLDILVTIITFLSRLIGSKNLDIGQSVIMPVTDWITYNILLTSDPMHNLLQCQNNIEISHTCFKHRAHMLQSLPATAILLEKNMNLIILEN